MPAPIRILLGESQTLIRSGLRRLLETAPGFEVIGEALDEEEVAVKARLLCPDVILLDVPMSQQGSIATVVTLQQTQPSVRILVFTSGRDDHPLWAALQAGALGCLHQQSPVSELFAALHKVYQGQLFLPPALAKPLLHTLERRQPVVIPNDNLTPQEQAVLIQLAYGRSNQAIAERLGMKKESIRSLVHQLLHKLHLTNRTQAALYALKHHYITLADVQAQGDVRQARQA